MQFLSVQDMHKGAQPTPKPTLEKPEILGLPVVNARSGQVISKLLDGTRRTVFFLNAHCANIRARNHTYRAALARADMILPDGIGVEVTAKLQGVPLAENLNGTDFVPKLLKRAARLGQSVYLLGGSPGTAQAAAARLQHMIPDLVVVGTRDGYEGAARVDEAIDDINQSGADILLIAMGVPLQELWITQNRHRLDPGIALGVGALFDFLAGNVRRAPRIVRRARMEWAWRLAMEPRRMARRYLVGNFEFLVRVAHNSVPKVSACRLLDLTLAVVALSLLALPMAAIAALVRLDSRGSAFFRQTRIGRNGVPFTMYKFRSMTQDAEARRADLLTHSDRKGLCFKAKNDPRITRVGKVLRRFSLDELPQIFNVLKGDMSLVGPRPALPEEVAAYPEQALERLQVRPGITGLWQVSGRAGIGFDHMIALDAAYVRSRSPLLNLILIAMTARAVVSGRGAY
ncbi:MULTISPECIES: WecB/TagA/CpsF family glycosyltransferase [unclassified Ruegeria]|uniref:WecB/TagA/CpsF family glycosyltransferase n=1 Tax=unclassified Ruegeria TaxID=2625375 RepID=UPI0020C236A1|nr:MULTISPECIES: WecB/TagA/CpsF family glycosyltransferase [unclassified Ruegeria]